LSTAFGVLILVGKSGRLHRQLGDIPKEKIVLEQPDAFTSVEEGPGVRIRVRKGLKG
jgi:hypothetical protein